MKKIILQILCRLLALVSDGCVSINLYFLFHALGPYEIWQQYLGSPWPFLLGNFLLLRIIFNMALGIGPSQFVLGLRPEGPFLWKRVGGVLRCVYEIPFFLLFP